MYDFNQSFDRTKTNAEKYALREKLFHTDDVIPMWVADMDIATAQFIIDDIQKRLNHPILGYEEFPEGGKKALKTWLKNQHGYNVDIENIIFSPSVVTSINVAIKAFTEPNDEIIVQTPVYPPFFKSIQNNKRKVIYNPLKKDQNGNYTFDIEDLKSKITKNTKMLLLCSPHNPVGRVWEKKELLELAKVCLKHNIIVFADEIHSDLVFKEFKHTPFGSLEEKIEDLTISAYGVGKTFNLSGISTSTVIIKNEKLKKKFLKKYDSIHFAQGNILGHIAFQSAYEKGSLWKDELLIHLEKNQNDLENMLANHKDKIDFKKSQGTYLAWLDCRKMNLSEKKLRQSFIKEAKLGLSPGITFGKEGLGHMRLNFAVPRKTMDTAIDRIDGLLRKLN